MVGMRDNMLQSSPFTLFGSFVVILVPYMGCHINEVTSMMVSFGEAKTRHMQKDVCMVAKKTPAARTDGPLKTDVDSNVYGSGVAWGR